MAGGRATHVGWAEEAVWGTLTTPVTKFGELVGESFSAIRTRTPRPIFRDLDAIEGELYDELDGGGGSFTIEGRYEDQLRLLEHALGIVNTVADMPEVGVHQHTFTLATGELLVGKGLSVAVFKDLVQASTMEGGKIRSLRMSFDPTRNAQFEWDLIGQNVTEVAEASEVFAAPGTLIAGHQALIEIDDGAVGVDAVEITIDNALDDNKRVLGDKQIIEPTRADRRVITGSITLDAAQSDYQNFLASTLFKLEVLNTGPTIPTKANPFKFEVTLLKCLITDDPVNVSGPGQIKATIPFRALKPTTGDLISIFVQNAEAAVA